MDLQLKVNSYKLKGLFAYQMWQSHQEQIEQQDNSVSNLAHSIHMTELNLPRQQPLQDALYDPINIQQDLIQEESDSMDTSKSSECDVMAAIASQTHKILQIEEQLYYFRTQSFKLMHENDKLKQNEANNQKKIIQLKASLRKQREISDTVASQLQIKIKQICGLRKEVQTMPLHHLYPAAQLEEIQRQKQIIFELTTKNDKILKINKFLQEQLKTAERKLVEVEKDAQLHLCSQLSENVVRFKENQNYFNRDLIVKVPTYIPPLMKNDANIFKSQVDKNGIEIQSSESHRERKQFKTLQKEKNRQSNGREDKGRQLKSHRLHSRNNVAKKYRFD